MARDKDKYQYLLIGLLKESDGLKWLLEDAKQHHMEDQLAKLAAIRLTEFYEQQHGRLIPLRIQAMGVATSGETGALSALLPSTPAPQAAASQAANEGKESEEARSDAIQYTGGDVDEKRLSVWEM